MKTDLNNSKSRKKPKKNSVVKIRRPRLKAESAPESNKRWKGKNVKRNKPEFISDTANWKPVPVDFDMDLELEGFGGIEELSDYKMLSVDKKQQTVNEKSETKQNSSLKGSGDNKLERLVNSPMVYNSNVKKKKRKPQAKTEDNPKRIKTEPVDSTPIETLDMTKWDELFVPEPVLRSLAELGFTAPTPIQALTLPSAIRSRMDILGAAETGSGKTLAFGIPLLHGILRDLENEQEKDQNGNSDNDDHTTTFISPRLDAKIKAAVNFEIESEDSEDCRDHGAPSDFTDSEDETKIGEKKQLNKTSYSSIDLEETGSDFDFAKSSEDEAHDINNADNHKPNDLNDDDALIRLEEERVLYSEVKMPDRPLRALVLTPTRELALQVQKHIQAVAKYTNIKVALVVGGMAPQKQIRILNKRPEIVVATPGRLWELVEQGEEHLNHLQLIRYLVIDEADRMAERGHFAELEKILDLIKTGRRKRQNFIFSATLTLVHDIPKRMTLKKKKFKVDQTKKIDSIMKMVGMKNKPKVVDLSKQFGTVDTLTEAKLFCEVEEKDLYLYYFWVTYPGRTLVFCNSIDCVRRLSSVFELLNCKPLPLHASMQQRQRLKNLDKFRDNAHSLLLATDVAARGLDIPGVEHVIHYQMPRTAETYVHRSGRTARALTKGLSLMLLSSPEVITYRKMCRTLNRDKDLPDFPVDEAVYSVVQQRVHLARELEVLMHRERKKSSMNRWIAQAAESLDVEVDDKELLSEMKNDSEEQAKLNRKLKSLRQTLSSLLQRRITPRGVLTNYPTKTGKLKLPSETSTAISVVGNKLPWQQITLKKPNKPKKKKWKKKKDKIK